MSHKAVENSPKHSGDFWFSVKGIFLTTQCALVCHFRIEVCCVTEGYLSLLHDKMENGDCSKTKSAYR